MGVDVSQKIAVAFYFGKALMSAGAEMPGNVRLKKYCMLWRDKIAEFKSWMGSNSGDLLARSATSQLAVAGMSYYTNLKMSLEFQLTITTLLGCFVFLFLLLLWEGGVVIVLVCFYSFCQFVWGLLSSTLVKSL